MERYPTFYFYRLFPVEFCKIIINSHFSENRHGFAFAMTYCLQTEIIEKKNVFGGSSFDNFFPKFHLQVALSQTTLKETKL